MPDFDTILSAWDIIPLSIEPFGIHENRVFRVTTGNGQVLTLKPFPHDHQAEREGAILRSLSDAGAPVPAVMRTRAGTFAAHNEDQHYMLYPFLEGETIQDHFGAGALQNARMFGAGLATLHKAMASVSQALALPLMDLRELILDYTRRTLLPLYPNLGSIYQVLDDELVLDYDALPVHMIHRDPHPGNMLVRDGIVTSYLDFEISVRGPRIFDVAYATTAILSEAPNNDPARRLQWLDIAGALVKGYHALNPLLPVEIGHLWHIQLGIQLLFAAYFTSLEMPVLVESNLSNLWWMFEARNSITARLDVLY